MGSGQIDFAAASLARFWSERSSDEAKRNPGFMLAPKAYSGMIYEDQRG